MLCANHFTSVIHIDKVSCVAVVKLCEEQTDDDAYGLDITWLPVGHIRSNTAAGLG